MSEHISEETIAKVKAENPGRELHLFGNEFGQAIFRSPTRSEYERMLEERHNEELRVVAPRNLVMSCAIYPKDAELLALLDRYPGLINVFAGELASIAGAKSVSIRKKL